MYNDLKGMIEKGLYTDAQEMQGKLDYFYRTRKKITKEQYDELTALLARKEEEKVADAIARA